MRAVDIILRKRQGAELSTEEIGFFIRGYERGQIPDYQASALAMAVFFRGMTPGETVALTEAMMRTGEVLDLSDLPGPKVDKHSTGGVGDKTSLVLGPLAAACGLRVPMISGRGLGHTGGTLDKLESIPGFRVSLGLAEFRDVLRKCGIGLIGQTPEIAPADKKLYALRDVTGTVESLPLIAASIMSKKMAEGIDALVLDVKTGDGAFMQKFEDSRALAESMVRIGRGMGKKVVALITDMDQPLGLAAGNALETAECIDTLKGHGPADLESLSIELAAWMLTLGGAAQDLDTARGAAREALAAGRGLAKFQEVIALQGGDPRRLRRHHAACRRRGRGSSCPPVLTDTWAASAAAPWVKRSCCSAPAARPWTAASTMRWASCSTRSWATASPRGSHCSRSTRTSAPGWTRRRPSSGNPSASRPSRPRSRP